VNPDGAGISVGRFTDDLSLLMMMIAARLLNWLRRCGLLVLDIEPQVGFIHFAASGHLVGEFEVNRFHAFGGR
jgi:hypothetical protein